MKTTAIMVLLCALLVVGCTQQVVQPPVDQPVNQGCTEEAKVCPDGSSVGRNPSNNCEFDECPAVEPANPSMEPYTIDRRWVKTSREECAATDWMCPNGTQQFFDDTGCGCEAQSPRNYTSTDTDMCSRMLFMCVAPLVPFNDASGCGCGFAWPDDLAGAPSLPGGSGEGKLQATDCTDPRPQACTREYAPVCGQVQVDCIQAPCEPQKQTFGNKCEACANERTISYTQGECGDSTGAAGGAAGGTMPAFENVCTAEQKAAEACTMDYTPVCGDDLKTYGNACTACSSGSIDAWRPGECGPETTGNPSVS